jgi:hypothetical protein
MNLLRQTAKLGPATLIGLLFGHPDRGTSASAPSAEGKKRYREPELNVLADFGVERPVPLR